MSTEPLGYESRPNPTDRHNRIYTITLMVFCFFGVVGALEMWMLRRLPGLDPTGKLLFEVIAMVYAVVTVAMAATVALRYWSPPAGRIATVGINVVLLIFFPFGTALAIYGFWKVDKGPLRPSV
jgi:hypothetical protein